MYEFNIFRIFWRMIHIQKILENILENDTHSKDFFIAGPFRTVCGSLEKGILYASFLKIIGTKNQKHIQT